MESLTVGCPKEIKLQESRVGLTPPGVSQLRRRGIRVIVETHAGDGAGYTDEKLMDSGAEVVGAPEAVFDQAQLVVETGATAIGDETVQIGVEEDVIYYCVANMPGAYAARTSTQALTSVTLPNVQALALGGVGGAIEVRPELVPGINYRDGRLIQSEMAAAHG